MNHFFCSLIIIRNAKFYKSEDCRRNNAFFERGMALFDSQSTNVYRRRHVAVDIAVVLVGAFSYLPDKIDSLIESTLNIKFWGLQ